MKRLCALFLVIVMLFSTACADFSCELTVGDASKDCTFSLQGKMTEEELLLHTSLIPDVNLSFPLSGLTQASAKMESLLADLQQWLDEDMLSAFVSTFQQWRPVSRAVTEKGDFAGDLFANAESMTSFTVNIDDVLSLLSLLEENWQLEQFSPVFALLRRLGVTFYELLCDLRLHVSIYDAETRTQPPVALTLLSGEDVLMTLCAVGEDENSLLAFVLGFAENGRTYYYSCELSLPDGAKNLLEAKQLELLYGLIADDYGTGYWAVKTSALFQLSRLTLTLDAQAGQLTLADSNERGLPVSLQAQLRWKEQPAFEASVLYAEEPLLTVQLKDDVSCIDEYLPKVVLGETVGADAYFEEIAENLQGMSLKLFQALPAEFILLLMQLGIE